MGIRIITDSTSDISIEEAKKLDITLVPLKVIFGDKEYKEGVEISIGGFYEKLVKADKIPTTSQPAPDDFLQYFMQAKEAGDSIIVMVIAGKLSGTLQSATIAKEMADYSDIYIIDSNTTTSGLRILVEHAVKLKNEGKSVSEIFDVINKLKERVVLLAIVDTLEFLYKGGRLSKSSAILGSLLNFKPIINLKDGAIGVVGKERGTNKAIVKVMETMDGFGKIDRNYPVNLGYTAEDSKCILLKEKLVERFSIQDMKMYPVGCVIGTHAGPGACVITYVKE